MISLAVIESKAALNSAGTALLAAPEFVFTLDVGTVVHASAKLSTAANETIPWSRFFILVDPRFRCWICRMFYAETWAQVKLDCLEARTFEQPAGRLVMMPSTPRPVRIAL